MSDVPPTNAPRGFLPAMLMSLASRIDGGDTPPPFQRVQTMVLIALLVDLVYPHMPF